MIKFATMKRYQACDSTNPPTTSSTPIFSVNASDVGAGVSGFASTHISPLVSPFHTDDPNMIYGDTKDDLQGFTFTRFDIRTGSDEALITKGRLKTIHEKLDSLLQSAKPSSFNDYSQSPIESMLETLTK
ncbi:unnamed protein product [Lactuca saligna]|uniref:Uncharacterized protein n=1 Tax=Lactuca saligna TaxID=75948 RepID=A0AA35ZJM5_LACSI|nr:unnamed protein product [Lactuca saligna]